MRAKRAYSISHSDMKNKANTAKATLAPPTLLANRNNGGAARRLSPALRVLRAHSSWKCPRYSRAALRYCRAIPLM